MANRGINAGSLRQYVQALGRQWRGGGPWCSQKRAFDTIVAGCAPLISHPCIRNRPQNSNELQTLTSSFQFLVLNQKRCSDARGMSINTKRGVGGSVHSTRVPDKDSSARDKGEIWRKDFMEKQAKQQKKFDNVKAPPAIEGEDWWTPDPFTGVYVPDYYHGCVTTAPRKQRASSGGGTSNLRVVTNQDQGQTPWFDNMDELPDMDRHKKK